MLKQQYRILKYIYKNPETKKSKLLQKFPDFEKYERSISEYVYVTSKNNNTVSEIEEKLFNEANEKHLSILESSEYVRNNMPKDIQNITDNSLITYSTKLNFQEYLESNRHDEFVFWLPYTITTFIALVSAAPTIYKIVMFICELFQKSTH